MNKTIRITVAMLLIGFLAGCNYLSKTLNYKDKTKTFIETLINEDYNGCVDQMAMDHEMARNVNKDSMIMGLATFRDIILQNWGSKLEYKLIKAEKRFTTVEKDQMPPNTTLALVEIHNHKTVGMLQILFDDKSNKLLSIKPLDINEPIPSMLFFWLFGLLAISVPVFNIVVIRQIKKSDLNKKWRKYLAVIVLNVPTITYAAIQGLSFKLISFQMMLGIGTNFGGYLERHWSVGLPLGGLYWFLQLRKRKRMQAEAAQMQMPETETTESAGE